MNARLILRTLISPFITPYTDLTKGSVLSHDDVDNNFIYLKGESIYSAGTENGLTLLKKLNGTDLTIPDVFITGGTFTSPTLTLTRNDGTDVQINGITTSVGNQLLSGGASYLSGLTFAVTTLTYIIDNVYYTANSSTVVVASGDSTHDRIDVIVVDVSGNTSVVQGTPAANPVKPDIDESTQLEVTFITVAMGATTIALSSTLVYAEKVGPPSEWTFASPSSPFISGNSTTTSYSGTVCIALSAATNAKSFTLSSSTVFNSITQNTIQFAIKNKIAWTSGVRLRFTILSSTGVQVGTYVDLYNGRFGFSTTNTTSWQLLSIPLSNFALTTTLFSQIKVLTVNSGAQVINCYIDNVKMVEGVPTVAPNPAWLNMRVNGGTSIPALVPNDTLTFSGGTGISTSIVGPRTILITATGSTSGGGFSGWTGSTGIGSIKANNTSNLQAPGKYSLAAGSATTATTIASVAMGVNSLANGGYDVVYTPSGVTVVSAVTISTTDPNNGSNYGNSIKLAGNVVAEWTSYISTYSSIFSLSGSGGSIAQGNTIPVHDIYYDSGYTYIVNDKVPIPITVVSAITVTASDPFYSLPAIVIPGVDVSVAWTDYFGVFNTTFTLYGGSGGTTTFDTAVNAPFCAFDGTDTYLVDQNGVLTDFTFTQISGDSFYYGGYLTATTYTQISGTSTILVPTGIEEHPAFAIGRDARATGQESFAIGTSTRATGNNSFAEGFQTTTTGVNSHAEGANTAAYGLNSHTEGKYTYTYGENAHAEGFASVASGTSSHAEGYGGHSNGTGSHAEGINSAANGDASHAEGGQTIANGNYSHTEGFETTTLYSYAHAEGYHTTAMGGYGAHAEGVGTIANGHYTHAEGNYTTASGDYGHAEGTYTVAIGGHAEGAYTTANGGHAEGYSTTTISGGHAEGNSTISIGNYSHSEGSFTSASGASSHTEGAFTTTLSDTSHAEGSGTTASGLVSHSEGFTTTASGDYSHSEGISTTASGIASHAGGNSTIASGVAAHAEGYVTTASGNFSHAEGSLTTASNSQAHAEGANTKSLGNSSHTEGSNTLASGPSAHAEGEASTASGDYSHAEGYTTTSSGLNTHTEGRYTRATAQSAHAEGDGTYAIGTSTHAEGQQTTASGYVSHAEGELTIASGSHAHSGGRLTAAVGDYSFVYGSGSTASGLGTVVLGIGLTGTTDYTTYTQYLVPKITSYVNDAAADADTALPSGALYKLNASRAVFVKP